MNLKSEGKHGQEEALLIAKNNAVERIINDSNEDFNAWKEEKIDAFYLNLNDRSDFQAIIENHFRNEFDPLEIRDHAFESMPFSEYFNRNSNIVFSIDDFKDFLEDQK